MKSTRRDLNILLFWFNDDWGRFGRAYERVAESLAKLPEVNHVVCMFPPASASQFGLKSVLRVRPISEKLTLITETDYQRFRLDTHLIRIRRYANRLHKSRALPRHLRKLGFRLKNTVLWIFPPHPYLEHLLNVVPHRLVVSHIIDDFTKSNPDHELYGFAKVQYPRIPQWSDLIFTTSEANHIHFSALHNACHMFWPAVDESFVGQPQTPPSKALGKSPRLGYIGWIMDRTDIDLLEYVARQRPQWRLVMAGPQYPEGYLDKSGLLSLPNVEYLGLIPQSDVPGFLCTLDVCLMPHRDTEYSRSMGPLKLYQYLASGRPVVSTKVAGLDLVRELVRVASNRDEFIAYIEDALETDSLESSAKRIQVARQNTWAVRVREMLNTVMEHI